MAEQERAEDPASGTAIPDDTTPSSPARRWGLRPRRTRQRHAAQSDGRNDPGPLYSALRPSVPLPGCRMRLAARSDPARCPSRAGACVPGARTQTGARTVKYEIANPHPAGTIESLRSLGYSTEAAVADLVDNSIAAEAQQVDVVFTWDGRDSWVAVIDDGRGMTESRAGHGDDHRSPRTRAPNAARQDLGRFGMGLKTASFSQARQLIVTSAPHGRRTQHPGLGPGPGQADRAMEAPAGRRPRRQRAAGRPVGRTRHHRACGGTCTGSTCPASQPTT